MRKDMDDTDELVDKLKEILGKDARIAGVIKGRSHSELLHKAKQFMDYPIVVLSASRSGTKVNVQRCDTEEAYEACMNIITNCLQLFPKDRRNELLYYAIDNVEEKYDEGMLYMEDNEDEDEDE